MVFDLACLVFFLFTFCMCNFAKLKELEKGQRTSKEMDFLKFTGLPNMELSLKKLVYTFSNFMLHWQ